MFESILADERSLIHVLPSLLKIKIPVSVTLAWRNAIERVAIPLRCHAIAGCPSFPPFKFILEWHVLLNPWNLLFWLLNLNPVFRQKLGRIFNACILARKCRPDCGHVYGEVSLFINSTEYLQDMTRFNNSVLLIWTLFYLFFRPTFGYLLQILALAFLQCFTWHIWGSCLVVTRENRRG